MEQIGEYIVRRLVGEGGMGKVYEAEERLSKRRVALKVLRDELARSESARGLFLNEMQILAHLEHPNIVRSLACFEADQKLVTVLEFLEGRTLREVITDRGRLPWDEASYVVVCVAKALVAAHGQKPPVIHRDLKPENIMVLGGGSVKVMDFGIAKLVQELNQTNTQSVGTLQYMSPEQIDAQTVDQRSDLYCLGLIFYELLTGRPPFTSSSPRQLLNLQCTAEPPPLDDAVRVSKGIERLLFGLLEKDPERRPATAAEVVERLEEFLPARSFDAIADADAEALPVAPAPAERSDTRTLPSAGHEADSRRSSRGARRAARAREAGEDDASSARDRTSPRGAQPAERKDTVALIDQAAGERELSTGLSLLIIVVLMLLAGGATYLWRASQSAPEPAEAGSIADP